MAGGGCQRHREEHGVPDLGRLGWRVLVDRYSGAHLATPGRDRQLSGGPRRKNKAQNCPGKWTRGACGRDTFWSKKDPCLHSTPPLRC